jgi:methionyl-tRNA formyltransferase
LRILFAGTPDFAVPVLAGLANTDHEIVMVLTQPDRPSGRGRKLSPSPVKQFALEHQLEVYQPTSLKDPEVISTIQNVKPDLIIVIAYGLIVPQAILDYPKLGCICAHLSLLPRWRGAAPAQRALLAGDSITGVTIFKMDSGIDTGEILAYATLNIDKQETTGSLYPRLGELSANALLESLPAIEQQSLTLHKQDHDSMTYAVKISKSDANLNWELSAQQIERMIRAFNPWPVAYTFAKGERLRIWQADVIPELTDAPHGMIIGTDKIGVDVSCGAGILRITQLQWAGGNVQTAEQALNANSTPLIIGTILLDANE